MVKIYEYNSSSVCSAKIAIKVGSKATLSLSFQHGSKGNGSQSESATYASRSALEQRLIEDSELFKNGTIRIKRTYNGGDIPAPAPARALVLNKKASAQKTPKVEAAAPVVEEPADLQDSGNDDTKAWPDVKDIASAIPVLKKEFKAKATDLMNEDTVKKFISDHGLALAFPNLSL